MAASVSSPLMKKPIMDFPPRRRIKAQIFEEIAEAVVSAALRACDILGLIKKDDTSAPATPLTNATTCCADGGDGRHQLTVRASPLIDFMWSWVITVEIEGTNSAEEVRVEIVVVHMRGIE
ncbi:hypothetical protein E3N88_45375 [Mikania micrantha]|uniref:Uncharacterized protein n=1 Tax=Mikania micrantha TaxID=192012 RepID=A0A5N6L9E4_9ASTR|nr:hypothetical protein E3N88_45375 [Mikania micrantha]